MFDLSKMTAKEAAQACVMELKSVTPLAALTVGMSHMQRKQLSRELLALAAQGLLRAFKFDGRMHCAPSERAGDAGFVALFALETTRCDPSGCMHWTGSTEYRKKEPRLSFCTGEYRVRRVIYEQVFGVQLTRYQAIRMTCGESDCIQPKHMKSEPRHATQKGRKRSLSARKQMSMQMRKRATTKTNLEAVRWAREKYAAGELTQAKAAKALGISASTMSRIVRGVEWIDYDSPYRAL